MKPRPPHEVIRTTASTGGLVHVSAFLAQAFGAPLTTSAPPAPCLPAQPGIAKCRGAGLACCSVCMRSLTHAAAGQQWVTPTIVDGACALYASLERYGAMGAPA